MGTAHSGAKVILDRCNVEVQDRAFWLELAMRPKTATAVFFDVTADVCKERIKARRNHPTIPFGSGETALGSFAKKLVPPTREEGFSSVRVVKTIQDAEKLVREFGGVVTPFEEEEQDVEAVTAEIEELSKSPSNGDDGTSGEASEEASSSSSPAPKKEAAPAATRGPVAKPVTKGGASKKPQPHGKKGKETRKADSDDDDGGNEEGGYFKFPRTRHIHDMGSATRDDLLFSAQEAKEFFSKGNVVSVEEKVDGANMGFSISSNFEIRTQNRAHFVNSSTHRQFSQLDAWVEEHRAALFEILEPGRHILFGEWLYAKHSVYYSRLPGYFLAFDIFDKQEERFLSRQERTRRLEGSGIPVVPLMHYGPIQSQEELLAFLERPSQLAEGNIEGIYCRIDDGPHLRIRGKIVRSEFMQQIEQPWTHQTLVKNKVEYSYD